MPGFDAALDHSEIATPSRNPATGRRLLYPKGDGSFYTKGPLGAELKLDFDHTCRVCDNSLSNPASAAPSTVDGVALAVGDRVLKVGTAGHAQNGIYTVVTVGTGANGVWARSADADTSIKLAGQAVAIQEGTQYSGSRWRTPFRSYDTLGSTAMWWFFSSQDLAAVHNFGDEPIDGIKTFNDPPVFADEPSSPIAPITGSKLYSKGGRMWVRTSSAEYQLAVSQTASNLLLNGSFETPKAGTPPVEPLNWNGFWHAGSTTLAQDNSTSTEGLYCCKVSLTAPNADNIVLQSDLMSVTGGTLVLDFDVKGEVGAEVQIELQSSAGTGPNGDAPNFFATGTYNTGGGTVSFADSSWQHVTRAIPVYNTHTLARLTLRTKHAGADATAHLVYYDNVTARMDPQAQLPVQWTKQEVRVIATANIALADLQTIDGFTVAANDRVLAIAQTNPKDNGIYTVVSGAAPGGNWIRSADADTATEISGAQVAVLNGTTYGGTRWGSSFKANQVVGTDPQLWTQQFVDTTEWITAMLTADYTPTAATTTVPFTNKVAGSAGMSVDGSGQIVIGKAGIYHVVLAAGMRETATGYVIWALVHKRGGGTLTTKEAVESTAAYHSAIITGDYDCQAGDIFQATVMMQIAGGAMEANRSQLVAHRLSGVGPAGPPGPPAADTGWIPLPFWDAGWANYGGAFNICQYRKIGTQVFLRGLANRTGAAVGSIALLPTGFRPPADLIFTQHSNTVSPNFIRVDVTSAGAVSTPLNTFTAGQYVSLADISFFID